MKNTQHQKTDTQKHTRRKILISFAGVTAASGCMGTTNNTNDNTDKQQASKLMRKDKTTMRVSPHNTHPKQLLLTPDATNGEMLYIKEPKSNIDNKSHYYVGKKILTSLSALGTPLEELSIKQNISITQSKDTAKKVYEQTVDKIETRYKEKPTVKSTNIGDKGGLVRVNFNRTDQIMCLDNYFVHTILFDTNNNKDINNYTRKIEKNIKSI